MFDDVRRRYLLEVARQSIHAAFGLPFDPPPQPSFERETVGGAFVSLYREGLLRGCVGAMLETTDVVWLVREAGLASVEDTRFAQRPILAEEVPALAIEVSVLSVPTQVRTPTQIVPGVHGIRIEAGGRSGCFLPKVAMQYQWDAVGLLEACCTIKLGLPAHSWQLPGARVHVFTAEVFSE